MIFICKMCLFVDGINFDALIDHACVFHFRFATHGSTSPGNCHPFPVEGNLKRQRVRTDVAVALNGIIRDIPIAKKDYSDTMSYIERHILSLLEAVQRAWSVHVQCGGESERIDQGDREQMVVSLSQWQDFQYRHRNNAGGTLVQ